MTADIVTFIRARLNEQARQCSEGHRPGECHPNCGHVCDLRGVDAKRRILDLCDVTDAGAAVYDGRDPDERERDDAVRDALAPVLLALASEWSDDADYRQEWTP